MKFLYIFPHPDDESFGPAAAIHAQLADGHEAHLLTLTRGGATIQRHRLGLSIEEMGEVRLREMREVERTLGLSSMTVLDYPDSGLKNLDPRILERVAAEYIRAIEADIVVTYAVHGISGFHDHLVTHAVVKRAFVELREQSGRRVRRLALLTQTDPGGSAFENGRIRLKMSDPEDIDCEMLLNDTDVEAMKAALSCYGTYQNTIEESGVVEKVGNTLYFEFFGESFRPPLAKIEEGL